MAALLIGGGTSKGLASTMVLEILALPMIFMVRSRHRDGSAVFGGAVLTLLGLILLNFAMQLLPLFAREISMTGDASGALRSLTGSGDLGRTIDSFAFTVTAILAFLAVASREPEEQNTILSTMLIGFIVNLVLALIQFAATNNLELAPTGYPMRSGIFANKNHFSSLLYVSIPFWVYQFDRGPWRYVVLAPVALILFIEFAAGSTAGVLIAVAATLLSLAFIWKVGTVTKFVFIAPILVGLILLIGNAQLVTDQELSGPLNRAAFAASTLKAIAASLPFGTGFGSFPIIYQRFATEGVYAEFVNHAHDDFLELVLEGGIAALLALFVYAGILIAAVWRRKLPAARLAALLAILFLLAHSILDYPLRTFAMTTIFVVANAMLLRTMPRSGNGPSGLGARQPEVRERRRANSFIAGPSVDADPN